MKESQLWLESSERFALPGSPNAQSSRWASPKMRALFWPSGQFCWQLNSYLISLRKAGSAVSTVNTYASELTLFLRYIFSISVSIEDVDDDTLIGYSDYLLTGQRSGSHVNRLILRVINYLIWHQRIFPGTNVIGPVGGGSQVTVTVRESGGARTYGGARVRHISMVPYSSPRIVRPISLSNIKKLVAAIGVSSVSRFKRQRDRCILTLLADSGMRREEVTWLRCQNILDAKQNNGRLRFRTSKRRGNPEREIPLPLSTLNLLIDYLDIYRTIHIKRLSSKRERFVDLGWAFPTIAGGQIAPVTISQIFIKLKKSANITERASSHMLRHRYITLQVIARLQALRKNKLGLELITSVLSQVASLSGHSNIRSMWSYVDWAFEELDSYSSGDVLASREVEDLIFGLMAEATDAGKQDVVDALQKIRSAFVQRNENRLVLTAASHSLRQS